MSRISFPSQCAQFRAFRRTVPILPNDLKHSIPTELFRRDSAKVAFFYKAPSIFTEEAEMVLFQNVLPIGNRLKAERSRGGTSILITRLR